MKAMALLIALGCGSVACAQTFTGIALAPGAEARRQLAMSADGTTVVGSSSDAAFRWRADTGPVFLGVPISVATSSSADGSIVVGAENPSFQSYRAFRWTDGGGREDLPGVSRSGEGLAGPYTSYDGQVVAGTGDEGIDAIRWTAATGMVQIPLPPLDGYTSRRNLASLGINATGDVIVGAVSVNVRPGEGFVGSFMWTAAGGTDYLRAADGTVIRQAGASALSADGSVVLVTLGSTLNLWTSGNGLQLIPILPRSYTIGLPVMSGDAMTVGSGGSIWTAAAGTRDVSAVLLEAGCDISGWSGLVVTGLSYDGRAMCGYGVNPQGLSEGWHATVPSPWGVVVLAGVLGVGRRRRKPLA
jgi:hypothetical protein